MSNDVLQTDRILSHGLICIKKVHTNVCAAGVKMAAQKLKFSSVVNKV